MSKTAKLRSSTEHPPLMLTMPKESVPLCLLLLAVLDCCFSFIHSSFIQNTDNSVERRGHCIQMYGSELQRIIHSLCLHSFISSALEINTL